MSTLFIVVVNLTKSFISTPKIQIDFGIFVRKQQIEGELGVKVWSELLQGASGQELSFLHPSKQQKSDQPHVQAQGSELAIRFEYGGALTESKDEAISEQLVRAERNLLSRQQQLD